MEPVTKGYILKSYEDDVEKKPKTIVDVGCGIKGSTRYLAKKYGAECHMEKRSSPVQAEWAQALAADQGLADKLSVATKMASVGKAQELLEKLRSASWNAAVQDGHVLQKQMIKSSTAILSLRRHHNRLQQWCKLMLKKAAKDGIVVDHFNLYNDCFLPTNQGTTMISVISTLVVEMSKPINHLLLVFVNWKSKSIVSYEPDTSDFGADVYLKLRCENCGWKTKLGVCVQKGVASEFKFQCGNLNSDDSDDQCWEPGRIWVSGTQGLGFNVEGPFQVVKSKIPVDEIRWKALIKVKEENKTCNFRFRTDSDGDWRMCDDDADEMFGNDTMVEKPWVEGVRLSLNIDNA